MLSDINLIYPILIPIATAILVIGAGTLFERVAGGKLQRIREIIATAGFSATAYVIYQMYWNMNTLKLSSDIIFALSATTIYITPTFYFQYMPAGYILTILMNMLYSGSTLWTILAAVTAPPTGSVFAVDFLSILMAAAFTGLGLLVCIYSIQYMEHDTGKTKFYALLLILVASLNGIVFSGDLFTLFIFFEIMSISAYCLVGFRKEKWEPVEAGFKYLIMVAVGSSLVLYAMSFIYGYTGTLNFAYAGTLINILDWLQLFTLRPLFYLIIALLIAGFGVEAAIVPLHFWLPDAHPAAPSGMSAMLSGVVIASGVYTFIRTLTVMFPVQLIPSPLLDLVPLLKLYTFTLGRYSFPVGFPAFPVPYPFDWNNALVVLAIVTMVVANVMALLQKDLKRLLAYSSILNIGFILIGFSTGTLLGFTASWFHVINHAIMKGLLFLCAGAYLHATGSRMLDDLSGIGRKMPTVSISVGIGGLALIGLPPFNGFWSKLLLILSPVQLAPFTFNGWVWITLAVVAVISSGFSAIYYLRLIQIIWFGKESAKVKSLERKRAPVWMLVPIVLLAAACVVFGIFPGIIYSLSSSAAGALYFIPAYFSGILPI
nr:proton-conducting transporter membrane subunit [Candidatus Freyarchaeota archaeon]